MFFLLSAFLPAGTGSGLPLRGAQRDEVVGCPATLTGDGDLFIPLIQYQSADGTVYLLWADMYLSVVNGIILFTLSDYQTIPVPLNCAPATLTADGQLHVPALQYQQPDGSTLNLWVDMVWGFTTDSIYFTVVDYGSN